MTKYADLLERKGREYGDKFDPSELDPRFIPYYESGQRIRVETFGEVKTGTVGVTTGWRPVFLLMLTRRSIGSPWTLRPYTDLVAKQVRGKYEDV